MLREGVFSPMLEYGEKDRKRTGARKKERHRDGELEGRHGGGYDDGDLGTAEVLLLTSCTVPVFIRVGSAVFCRRSAAIGEGAANRYTKIDRADVRRSHARRRWIPGLV